MSRIECYHDWLRGAHTMEKQAEPILEFMASRIDNYPELRARIGQHLSETKNQIARLETVLDRNNISRSIIKDSMSKMAALGQPVDGIFPSDGMAKGSVSGHVFEQFETACYTSPLIAAKDTGGITSVPTVEAILNEEKRMADWLIQYIPQTIERFLIHSGTDGVKAKK